MKTVGIIGRAQRNQDEQEIIQINEYVRRALTHFDDVATIALLPTNDLFYCNLKSKHDRLSPIDRAKLDHILKQCDGIIAPGGSSWFQFDEYIINHAIANDKPFLGICAGFQCLCGMYSDTEPRLFEIPNETHKNGGPRYSHTNFIVDHTKLKEIIGQDTILVNSSHRYGVNPPLRENIIISAYSEDDIIEAVEVPDKKFAIGVQWHPEYIYDENSQKIFRAFVNNLTSSQSPKVLLATA